MQSPLVSVIIGTYNRAGVIRETLDSVFAQDYPSIEIVVVDDASRDDTLAILRSYGDRIRLIERAENSGSADIPRWEALEACRGEYAALLDSDDAWDPAKISKQVAFMEANPEVGFSHHYVRRVTPSGENLGIRHEGKLPATGQVAKQLLDHCFVCTSSVMVKPSVWLAAQRREDLGGFGTEWDFFLAIARQYPVGLVDEVLGSYRVDPDSVSHGNWRRGPWDVLAMERLRRKGLHDGLCGDSKLAEVMAEKALLNSMHFRERNQPWRALWFWRKAWSYTPFRIALFSETMKILYRAVRPYRDLKT